MISDMSNKVLGPDEQPKSAMPMLSIGTTLCDSKSWSTASSMIGFAIDNILFYKNRWFIYISSCVIKMV